MSEAFQIVIGIILLIFFFLLAKSVQSIKIRRACEMVVKDLKQKGALDSSSAVTLPYATSSFFRIGLRDYRPKAINTLVMSGIIGTTEEAKFYLKQDINAFQTSP
jgi:hypothetical protein